MASAAPSNSGDTSFAAVLAEQAFDQRIAYGMRKPPVSEKPASGNIDLLADDIATISYEQALRTHTRNTPAWNQPPAGLFESEHIATDQAATSAQTGFSPLRIQEIALKHGRNERRSASITIRLSKTECDQIHIRAEQAGLTVSAYLRSCVLEAEDLRAQVKKMIAELKTAQGTPSTREAEDRPRQAQSRWYSFWARLFHAGQTAQA